MGKSGSGADTSLGSSAFADLKLILTEQFLHGFLPALGRARRSAGPQEKPYLDTLVVGMGAVMDEQQVRVGEMALE